MSGFVFFRCSGGYNNGRHREQTKKNGIICRLVRVSVASFLVCFFFFFYFFFFSFQSFSLLMPHTLWTTDTFRDQRHGRHETYNRRVDLPTRRLILFQNLCIHERFTLVWSSLKLQASRCERDSIENAMVFLLVEHTSTENCWIRAARFHPPRNSPTNVYSESRLFK